MCSLESFAPRIGLARGSSKLKQYKKMLCMISLGSFSSKDIVKPTLCRSRDWRAVLCVRKVSGCEEDFKNGVLDLKGRPDGRGLLPYMHCISNKRDDIGLTFLS